jgi:hypothetical protein
LLLLQGRGDSAEKNLEIIHMPRTVTMIGIEPNELAWMRLLILLLRHPDPVVPELAHQALLYLDDAAAKSFHPGTIPVDHTG